MKLANSEPHPNGAVDGRLTQWTTESYDVEWLCRGEWRIVNTGPVLGTGLTEDEAKKLMREYRNWKVRMLKVTRHVVLIEESDDVRGDHAEGGRRRLRK